MAVGDVVSDVFNTINTELYFQPAVGVEVMILAIVGSSANFKAGLYDGANSAKMVMDVNVTSGNKNNGNLKLGITNTHYFNIFFNSQGGYSGIQTK